MNDQIIHLTREQLYEKIWAEPASKLAKQWRISNVGLAKICKRYQIPRPGLGYWARKQHGYSVKKTPLPKKESPDTIAIHISHHGSRVVDEDQVREAEEKVISETKQEHRIVVQDALDLPHDLILRTQKSLEAAKSDERGLKRPRAKGTLSVRVGFESINRAMRIMDALIKALEAREMKVTVENPEKERQVYRNIDGTWRTVTEKYFEHKTVVSTMGEKLEISLEEKLERKEREVPPASKKQPYHYDGRTEYDYFPSGRLALNIFDLQGLGARHTWSDTDRKRLENLLNSFVTGLINGAVIKRSHRLEMERKRREWEEERQRAAEKERLRREEEERIKVLQQQVSNWHESQRIRRFIDAVHSMAVYRFGCVEPESVVGKWVTWATRYANRLDPLIMDFPTLLRS